MTTRRPVVDPFLRVANAAVEPEELLEPDLEPTRSPSRIQAFKLRLSHYGNRALGSGHSLAIAVRDTFVHVSTALAGSVILLPVVILVRGLYVLLRTALTSAKDILLSVARAVFDVLRVPFQTVSSLFYAFNKRCLFPILKRVREDDTFAVIALALLVAAGIAVYVVCRFLVLRPGF